MNIQSYITETHDNWHKGHIEPFWTQQSITGLEYKRSGPSADQNFIRWKRQGYICDPVHLSGQLCDMRKTQPHWNQSLIEWFEHTYNVSNVGTSYFRMMTDSVLPVHSDSYAKYRELFKVRLQDCIRVIVFPFDWSSGHVFEIEDTQITNWKSGDYICWQGTTPHMAANIGIKPRYSIQLTGHV